MIYNMNDKFCSINKRVCVKRQPYINQNLHCNATVLLLLQSLFFCQPKTFLIQLHVNSLQQFLILLIC